MACAHSWDMSCLGLVFEENATFGINRDELGWRTRHLNGIGDAAECATCTRRNQHIDGSGAKLLYNFVEYTLVCDAHVGIAILVRPVAIRHGIQKFLYFFYPVAEVALVFVPFGYFNQVCSITTQ